MARALVACTLVFAAFQLLPANVVGAEPEPLVSGSAVWTEDGKVELKVSWMGGACEKAGEPTVEAADGDQITDIVVIPTASTGEVCTLQMVTQELAWIVPVEPTTERVSVMVLAPDGQPRAGGTVEVTKAGAAS